MKYTVLVVNQSTEEQAIVRSAFSEESEKYNFITAMNGMQALALAQNKPDVILLDWELPDRSGMSILQQLKDVFHTKDIPVIVMMPREHLTEAFETGAIDFITKPIDKSELVVRLKSTLSLFMLLRGVIEQAERLELQSEQLELQKRKLEQEKKKTDRLLLNILPYEIAEQLKNKGAVQAKNYRMVSVLFTDFAGFTHISEQLSSEEIIQELDICFEKFDEIIGQHFVEKIKTIGDAYMCAGGLPIRNKSNPINTVLAGLQIQRFMRDFNRIKEALSQPQWLLRVGIHTGEVVAGVIGKKKFAYDIWGDTVNTASRMESSGEANMVNISGSTYKYIKEYFDCTYRGKIKAKNKGEIDMYFVTGIKPEFADDEERVLPNQLFKNIISQI